MVHPAFPGRVNPIVGTATEPTEYTDVKALNIVERAILEFQYNYPGTYMFQCHVTEHMELGLMGWFRVQENPEISQHRSP